MKLHINAGKGKKVRNQDYQDIVHLVAASEKNGKSPSDVAGYINWRDLPKLRDVFERVNNYGCLFEPSNSFVRRLISQ